MQVHPLAAQHAFIHRVILIAFNLNTPLYIFVNNNTTSHTAVAAGGFNPHRKSCPHPLKGGNLTGIIFCIAQFFDIIFYPTFELLFSFMGVALLYRIALLNIAFDLLSYFALVKLCISPHPPSPSPFGEGAVLHISTKHSIFHFNFFALINRCFLSSLLSTFRLHLNSKKISHQKIRHQTF
jgi:hypothetical protein